MELPELRMRPAVDPLEHNNEKLGFRTFGGICGESEEL